MLKLYMVMDKEAQELVPVVAHTAKEARKLGYKQLKEWHGCDICYIETQVRLKRGIAVPESITEPKIFDCCEETMPWAKGAWHCYPEYGEECQFFRICHEPSDLYDEDNPKGMTWEQYDAEQEEVSDGR